MGLAYENPLGELAEMEGDTVTFFGVVAFVVTFGITVTVPNVGLHLIQR